MLKQTVNTIIKASKSQPNIYFCEEGDVYDLLNSGGKAERYPAIVLTQGTHRIDDDTFVFSGNLFFIDRLTFDKKNKLTIQSHAIDVLHNIVKVLDSLGYDVTNEEYHTFTEKFADECSGAYLTFTLEITISECFEDY